MTLPKDRKSIWELAYRYAMEDPRTTGDVERARSLDIRQINGTDFMRECAWAIYGAGFRFTTLEKNWPALDKAYLRWDYKRIVEQSSAVEQNALQVIAHTGKVKAILAIAKLLNDQGWPEVQAEIFGRITWDARDNPEVSQELLSYLDGLPWVGQVLAIYIA